jgi:hypothetical protein
MIPLASFPQLSENNNQALTTCRPCWKHSRQSTGRPCVGRNGTVVSFPHCEQFVRVSVLAYACPRDGPCDGAPTTATRLPLQFLQRLGSFLNCLSWKKSCSPAVNTKSVPQSMHFKILSWYSIWRGAPISRPCSARETRIGKDPVHNVGRRFTSPSCLPPGFGPPYGVHTYGY